MADNDFIKLLFLESINVHVRQRGSCWELAKTVTHVFLSLREITKVVRLLCFHIGIAMEAKLWNWNPLLLPPRFSSLKLAFPSTTTRLVAHNSVSETVPIHKEKEQTLPSVKPTYSSTPPNRGLRTPHSGYLTFIFQLIKFNFPIVH